MNRNQTSLHMASTKAWRAIAWVLGKVLFSGCGEGCAGGWMGKTLKVPSEHLQRSILQNSTSVSRRPKKNYAKNVNRYLQGWHRLLWYEGFEDMSTSLTQLSCWWNHEVPLDHTSSQKLILKFSCLMHQAMGWQILIEHFYDEQASQVVLVVKNPPASAGDVKDVGSIPGLGRPSGEGYSNPLQYSYLENPRDRGAWQATVHRVTKSQTQLKRLSTYPRIVGRCAHRHANIIGIQRAHPPTPRKHASHTLALLWSTTCRISLHFHSRYYFPFYEESKG